MSLQPLASVDITREVCPMTYVRVKLALEPLPAEGLLEVWLRGDEPLRNVPRSLEDEGHAIVERSVDGAGRTRLLIRRGGDGGRGGLTAQSG